MAIRKIEHVGVRVINLEQSIAFYTKVLGLVHRNTLVPGNGTVRLGFLAFAGHEETEVELIENAKEFPAEGKVHHLAFTVDDVEAEFVRIKELNVPLRDTEITTLPDGSRYFFFYGPDGELLELFQPGAR
ncbi:lactoylglutathione lyase [Paenibacillus cellulosilyticus]|uniref:Lactoylglutathione lyase n=1 Tax=Paenibacillus cellulosilyticus TaxID=375489 RepID=A0A2V2Z315_9BACL|nr:VOC family protein [Paenibacillus cellulosilyticus]PWW07485.1 lactoylglutathione lyase [Paenibacillus cellulosilyticus]QKS44360.1 VOC family protein [Paenibacillus cellulosilyticus]